MIFTQSIRICQCTENKIIWNRNNHHKVFFTNVTLHISTPSLVFTNWYWRLKKIHCWLFWASRNVQCIVTYVQLWWKLQRPPRLWVLFPESLNLGYCSLLKKIINGMSCIIYGIVTASFSFKIPVYICLLTNVCRNYKTSNYTIFKGFISKNTNQRWVADLLECTCINKITCMLPRNKLWYPRAVNEILQIYRFTHFFLFQVT